MGGIYKSDAVAEGKRLEVPTATLTLTGQPAGARAVQTLTLTGLPLADETVTIGSTVYTWKAAPTTVAFQVKIGADASASLDNLIAAINLAAGAGTLYGSATTIHPTVRAVAGAGDTMDVRANLAGTAGNSIASTETLTNGSWGAATLAGGVAPETLTADGVVYSFVTALPEVSGPPNPVVTNEVLIGGSASITLDNLIAAMNGAAGAGTTYATGTTAQTRMAAAAGAGDTAVFTPTAGGATGTLTLAEAIANGSLNRTTIANGTFYAFELPASASPLMSIQMLWDATLAFAATLETSNKSSNALSKDANSSGWSAESGVTLVGAAGGSASSSMAHLSAMAARRTRLKVIPTAAGSFECWTHAKD